MLCKAIIFNCFFSSARVRVFVCLSAQILNKYLSYRRDRVAGGSVLAKSARRYYNSADNIGLSSTTASCIWSAKLSNSVK